MRILLIVSGSIAAYKSLDLLRNLKEQGAQVTTVLTRGGEKFVTPMSVAALSGEPVYTELFSLKDETEMGHIRLSRENDLILVVPASANMLAKMAAGIADDLASTILLATDKPVFVAPAMNHRMWAHPATQRNVAQLKKDGVTFIGPDAGALACGEEGEGRMCSPDAILSIIFPSPANGRGRKSLANEVSLGFPGEGHAATSPLSLSGRTALVTSGPTFEPIDPVRYLGNRSSGKQGHAIAEALARAGATVTLVTGPTALPAPAGVKTIPVTTAAEMLAACEKALPADIAVFAAAVSDWTVDAAPHKIKKRKNGTPPELTLRETPDILATVSRHKKRPKLVIGFAAETENLKENARAKFAAKGCDWLLANEVADGRIFGENDTALLLYTPSGEESWPRMSKTAASAKLVQNISDFFIPTIKPKQQRNNA